MGEKISVGDELPMTQIARSEFATKFGLESMRDNLSRVGQDWTGPKYKISLKARRDMELEKSSYNKNNPRMVELSKFPKNHKMPPQLPSGLQTSTLVDIVLNAQPDLMKKRAFKEKLKVTLNSPLCADILKSAFWWFYLDQFKPNKYKEQKDKLYHLASSKFVMLVMRQLDESDSFMSRFPFVLAQLIYCTFCWAYPQSHPKFDGHFRETIFQTCSIWMCGLKYQPNLAVSKWRLGDLEPIGFRVTTAKIRLATEGAHQEPVEHKNEKIKFAEEPAARRTLLFKKSSEKVIQANKFKRRGTVFLKKQKSPQNTAAEEPSRVCDFKTAKFNTAGVSPFLSSYIQSCEANKTEPTSWQPLINRTEIVAEHHSRSLTTQMAESRQVVKASRARIEQCIRDQQFYTRRLRDEWAKKSDEMNEQIQSILRSKKQTAIFAELCATHNTTARNAVPTDKILRLMNKTSVPPP